MTRRHRLSLLVVQILAAGASATVSHYAGTALVVSSSTGNLWAAVAVGAGAGLLIFVAVRTLTSWRSAPRYATRLAVAVVVAALLAQWPTLIGSFSDRWQNWYGLGGDWPVPVYVLFGIVAGALIAGSPEWIKKYESSDAAYQALLREALDRTLAMSELRSALEKLGLDESELWASVSNNQQLRNETKPEYMAYEASLEAASQRPRVIMLNAIIRLAHVLGFTAITWTLISPLFAAILILNEVQGSYRTAVGTALLILAALALATIATRNENIAISIVAIYVAGGCTMATIYLMQRFGSPVSILFLAAPLLSLGYIADRRDLRLQRLPGGRAASLNIGQEALRKALSDRIVRVLRLIINAADERRYYPVLDVKEAPGLRRAESTDFNVRTQAQEDLERLIASVEGGCFALTGARGAGKTMLIRAVCDGHLAQGHTVPNLAVLGVAPVRFDPKDFVVHLYATFCRAVIDYVQTYQLVAGGPWWRLRRNVDQTELSTLANDAAQRRLRLGRVINTSSQAKAGVRLGMFEFSGKSGVEVSRQALTYPELVAEFTEYISQVASTLRAVDGEPKVIICIDELDRLDSAEAVRDFLNEIKAIFAAANCYFLVSVSEDALRSFALQGHGMRDFFDSAFDEVVNVRHLNKGEVHRMLDERVIGMGIPFQTLIYCLSGGLPREVLRTARFVSALRNMHMDEIVGEVLQRDLTIMCEAAVTELIPQDAESVELVALLDRSIQWSDREERRATRSSLLGLKVPTSSMRVRDTILTLISFYDALAEFAGSEIRGRSVAEIRASCEVGELELLVKARRAIGANDVYAGLLVRRFREWCRGRAGVAVDDDGTTRTHVDTSVRPSS